MATRTKKKVTDDFAQPKKRKAAPTGRGKGKIGEPSGAILDEPVGIPNRFASPAAEKRYNEIKRWGFWPEKRVELKPGECDEFVANLAHRGWGVLSELPDKYDPYIVREFYANAHFGKRENKSVPSERYTTVRGTRVSYDEVTIGAFLGLNLPMDIASDHEVREEYPLQELEAVCEEICFPGLKWVYSKSMAQIVPRPHLTRLAKLWGTYLIHNVRPNSHTSDFTPVDSVWIACALNLTKTIYVARQISTAIADTVFQSGGKLGHPSLITSLCAVAGIQVERTESLKMPFNTRYLRDHVSADPPQAPPQQVELGTSRTVPQLHGYLAQQFEFLNLQNAAVNRKLDLMCQANYEHFGAPYPTLASFQADGRWPGDRPSFQEGVDGGVGAGPTDGAGASGTDAANVDMEQEQLMEEALNPF